MSDRALAEPNRSLEIGGDHATRRSDPRAESRRQSSIAEVTGRRARRGARRPRVAVTQTVRRVLRARHQHVLPRRREPPGGDRSAGELDVGARDPARTWRRRAARAPSCSGVRETIRGAGLVRGPGISGRVQRVEHDAVQPRWRMLRTACRNSGSSHTGSTTPAACARDPPWRARVAAISSPLASTTPGRAVATTMRATAAPFDPAPPALRARPARRSAPGPPRQAAPRRSAGGPDQWCSSTNRCRRPWTLRMVLDAAPPDRGLERHDSNSSSSNSCTDIGSARRNSIIPARPRARNFRPREERQQIAKRAGVSRRALASDRAPRGSRPVPRSVP